MTGSRLVRRCCRVVRRMKWLLASVQAAFEGATARDFSDPAPAPTPSLITACVRSHPSRRQSHLSICNTYLAICAHVGRPKRHRAKRLSPARERDARLGPRLSCATQVRCRLLFPSLLRQECSATQGKREPQPDRKVAGGGPSPLFSGSVRRRRVASIAASARKRSRLKRV